MWNDWGMGNSEWHVYALDGTFIGFDTVNAAWESLSGIPYGGDVSEETLYGEFGFGGYGGQSSLCIWRGDWRDCTEVASLLRDAADSDYYGSAIFVNSGNVGIAEKF